MKKRTLIAPFLIALFTLSTACSNEPLTEEPLAATPSEPTQKEPVQTNGETPCDFNLSNLGTNDTVIIDCLLDLGGQTINIPAGVTIEYQAGGDIINGTLNFSEGGIISGELLNGSLKLTGSTPSLKNDVFEFIPSRWDIVEGVVNDEIALNNRNILQDCIDQSKLMGAKTFSIDKMDAFFLVGASPSDPNTPKDLDQNAIHLYSNLSLEMTNNTFLRVQPNDKPLGILISIYSKDNVKVSGGNLIGDRWDHIYKIYSDGVNRSSHEWPVLLQTSASHNVIIENVNFRDSTGDGFVMGNPNEYRYNGSRFNLNIILKNCDISSSRRNNISVTDADDSLIENCIITDAGIGLQQKDSNGNTTQYNSNGVLPRTGLDIEPFIGGEDPNNLVYYARVQRLTVRGCTFTGNANNSIIDYTGEDTLIEGNFSDSGLSANHGWRTKFVNNTLISSKSREGIGISTGFSEGSYEVLGNSVSGFRVGIVANGEFGIVKNNTIEDFHVGIQPNNCSDYTFENNQIIGTDGVGISAYNISVNNLIFNSNKIEVDKSPLNWNTVNSLSTIFDNNQFLARNSGGYVWIKDSNNVSLINNTIQNATILADGATNFVETNNTFNQK